MSEIIFNKLLDDHNECEIIAILSLFTNVRVSKDELKTHNINNTNLNDKVKSTIKIMIYTIIIMILKLIIKQVSKKIMTYIMIYVT